MRSTPTRLMGVRASLAAFTSTRDYLIRENKEPPSPEEATLLDVSDAAYGSLLAQLSASFSSADRADGGVLQRSVQSMQAMDEFNRALARAGRLPRFTLPTAPSVETSLAGVRATRSRVKALGRAERELAVSCLDAHERALSDHVGKRSERGKPAARTKKAPGRR